MSGAAPARPMAWVLTSVAGLAVWAAHFATIYALSAVACERGWAARTVLGLPWVAAMVGIVTLLALALLAAAFRPARKRPPACLTEGGEAEPGFTRWFAGSTAVLAAMTVLFQALPAAMLPGCG